MNELVSFTRQTTFNIEPAETTVVSDGSIHCKSIQLPVGADHLDVEAKINKGETNKSSRKQSLQTSLASSTSSSPIYASGGNSFKEFRANALRNFRPSRAPVLGLQPNRPASLGGDTLSELDILSDVGLAGDSDTDAQPPPGLALSLSARKKLSKGEPRIKVPSAKTDNAEPTIQEETTQDILNLGFEVKGKNIDLKEQKENVSLQTFIEKPSLCSEVDAHDSTTISKKIVSFNLVPDVGSVIQRDTSLQEKESFFRETNEGVDSSAVCSVPAEDFYAQQETLKISTTSVDGAKLDIGPENLRPESPVSDADETQFNNSLDSSFYESDWQPRDISACVQSPRTNAERDAITVNEINSRTTDLHHAVEEKSKVQTSELTATPTKKVSRKPEQTNNSEANVTCKSSEESERQSDTNLISREYETKIKPAIFRRLDLNKRWTADTKNDEGIKNPRIKKNEACGGISNPLETNSKTQTKEGLNPVKVSAATPENKFNQISKPAEGASETRPVSESALHDTTPRASPLNNTQPDTIVTMASSDNYGYESETFEEILKDRNDLVKAEKTYQRRIRQLEEELKGMVNQCQLLSDENKELRKKLEDSKKSSPRKDPVGSVPNSDHVELASRVAKLETEKENLININEQLSVKLKDTEAKTKQFDSVFVENTKLKTKNVELERKTAMLNKEVKLMSDRMQESETETEGKIENVHKSNKSLQSVILDLKDENKALNSRITSKDNEIARLSTALDERRTELNEMKRAMGNETTTEVELRKSHEKLEKAQHEIDSVKNELEDIKSMLRESEDNKSKLQESFNHKDAEVRKLKADRESKEKMMTELRGYLDRSKLELKRLEESQSAHRDMEKDCMFLKSRIASLKAEIESSLSENLRLKQDREEMVAELERLRVDASHTGDAVLESKKYFRKWENERDARNRVEIELGKKDDDIHVLEDRLKQAAHQLNSAYAKLKGAEDERAQLANTNIQELMVNNKILVGENKKLRQMLVERNIELTHKSAEQTVFDSRIKTLERKQKDAEVRVKQLSGLVVTAEVTKVSSNENSSGKQQLQQNRQNQEIHQQRRPNPSDMGPSSKNSQPGKAVLSLRPQAENNHMQQQQTRPSAESRQVSRHFSNKSILGVTEPKVAFVSPRARPKGTKLKTSSTMTPPPEWDVPRKIAIDREAGSNHTPLSLPSILDTSTITPPDPHGGYFMLYKERVKRLHDRNF
ncbi:hypothetical protein ElyMa_005014700 [Elysia marginata]|uniref:Uncharacterized protein n=1 Tax=Elysia marginata TaxID=1093978 RepID=A0AAV4J7F6_9GAST|nr:hypothetical protein ElyMa_005014700 [Elysia marginata]